MTTPPASTPKAIKQRLANRRYLERLRAAPELYREYLQRRRHHKLQEDWGAFCRMIEGLPYFRELILGLYPLK